MALRFEASYFDIKGQKWRVEIHDTNFSGTASEIRLSGEGFATKWEGSEETLYSGIMPSSTTLEVINEGGDFDVFLSEVANQDEGDVRVDIYEYETNQTAGDGMLWWTGILLIDGIQQEDAPLPALVSLTATDDLAHLKTQRWTYTLPTGYDPGATAGIAYMLHRCLWECRNRDAFSDNDVFITSVQDIICEGYDESYLGSPGLDQFSLARFSFDIGTSPNEINPVDGVAPAWFMWDILQSIAITFNMRIFFARGHWRAWPVAVHFMHADGITWTDRVFGYQKDGDAYELNIGSAPIYSTDLKPGFGLTSAGASWPPNAQEEGLIKLGGGIKTHSTPVKYVKRQQDWRANYAIAQKSILYSGTTNAHILNDLGDLTRMDFNDGRTFFAGAAFNFGGNVNISRPSSSYPGTNNTLIARIELVWDCGDYRWHGPTDGWTTDQTGSVSITIGQDTFTNGGVSIINTIAQDTSGHPLPADSDGMSLTATLKLLNGYGGDITTSLVTGAYNSPQTTCISVLSCTFADEDQGSELHFIAETSRNNKVSMDQGSVLIGSVQGSVDVGHIEGLAGISDANWRNDNHWESYRQNDADLDIHRLGVNEIAAVHEVGREIESGDIQLQPWLRALTPLVTLVSEDEVGGNYDRDYWAPLTMSFACSSRTANVSRMRLDWDGSLPNISAPTGNLDGSFNPDATETDGSIPGGPDTPGVSPMPMSKSPGFNIPPTGDQGTNIGGKLSDVQDKTNHIEVDPGNGITAITIKAGSTAFDADKVSQGSTNKFATSDQLGKVDNLTITAATDLDTMRSDVATNNTKVGITAQQASDITANNAKVGITAQQASDITANNAKVGITTQQASDITANNAKVGITTQQASDITANNAKVGITAQQASDITTNNAKVGITAQQASDITTNNAKVGLTTSDTNKLGTLTLNAGGTAVTAFALEGEVVRATNIQQNASRSFATTTQLNTIASNTLTITSHTTSIGDIEDKTDLLTITQQHNLDTTKDKVGHIVIDGTNGITSLNVKTGSQPLTADEINTTSTTNKFVTQTQLNKVNYLGVSSATNLDTIRTTTGFITATTNGITSIDPAGSAQVLPLDNISDGSNYVRMQVGERTGKLNNIIGDTLGIAAFAVKSGATPLNADQVTDATTTAKFTDADGVQSLGHITSTASGITSLTTPSGGLDLDDAAVFFAGTSGGTDNRSGITNDRIATIEPDGGLGELSSGAKGEFLKSGGTTATPAWGTPPYVLASHSARMAMYYTSRYYYGSTIYGWSTETGWSSSQTSRTSIADDYAHAGIVAPTDISKLTLVGTIRNDSNAASMKVWLVKGSRPNGSTATTITLTDIGDQAITIAAADRHYNIDLTANNAGISAGDLIFILFERTELPNGTTYVNTSWTLHATP
jgi:hypothetical protein